MHESGDNSSGRKEGKDQNMKRILIFSGTTEGRRITEFLDGRNVKVYVSAATEYGKECTGEHENACDFADTKVAGRIDVFCSFCCIL